MENRISESAFKLREMIEKAIQSHEITREDYDKILHVATEDGHIDRHEKALLRELQNMIDDRDIRFVK
jgi:tellurite resistance protein